ncbi:hypothetical protein M885DRAFT_619586 [Pelagophyceae sp. CCMP2097]|nr:hypothetical protein M885DRAFT_619586 [Pelagophyceae sp. CCMP2097]
MLRRIASWPAVARPAVPAAARWHFGGALGLQAFDRRSQRRHYRPDEYPPPTPSRAAKTAATMDNKHILLCATSNEVLKLFEKKGSLWTDVNLSTAMIRLALLNPNNKIHGRFVTAHDPRLQRMVKRSLRQLLKRKQGRWQPRHVATFCMSLSKVCTFFTQGGAEVDPCPAFFRVAAEHAITHIAKFKPLELANMIWAYSTANISNDLLYDVVAQDATYKVDGFNSQDFANTLWAFANADYPAPLLFRAAAEELVKNPEKLDKFGAAEIANLAWSFAVQDAGEEGALLKRQLFLGIAKAAGPKVHLFNSQNVSKMCWCFAAFADDSPGDAAVVQRFLRELLPQAIDRMASFKSHEIADVAWAFAAFNAQVAKSGLDNVDTNVDDTNDSASLDYAAASSSMDTTDTFEGRQVHLFDGRLARDYAAESMQLFEALAIEAHYKSADFSAHDLTRTLWAFAAIKSYPKRLFRAFHKRAPEAGEEHAFEDDEIADLHWAYAAAGEDAPETEFATVAVDVVAVGEDAPATTDEDAPVAGAETPPEADAGPLETADGIIEPLAAALPATQVAPPATESALLASAPPTTETPPAASVAPAAGTASLAPAAGTAKWWALQKFRRIKRWRDVRERVAVDSSTDVGPPGSDGRHMFRLPPR